MEAGFHYMVALSSALYLIIYIFIVNHKRHLKKIKLSHWSRTLHLREERKCLSLNTDFHVIVLDLYYLLSLQRGFDSLRYYPLHLARLSIHVGRISFAFAV